MKFYEKTKIYEKLKKMSKESTDALLALFLIIAIIMTLIYDYL